VIDIAARFGGNLARQRKLADLSQDEVSVRASLHRTEVSQLERGLRVPRIDTVAKLAGALEVAPGEFFEGSFGSQARCVKAGSSNPIRTLRSEHGQAVEEARRSKLACCGHRGRCDRRDAA
jgi:transcriptional regulator with XRE-family HTH domain